MERDFETPESKNIRLENGKRITAFTAVQQDYGFKIEVAGCVCLRTANNGSEDVIGIVELDDQVVPILDSRKDTRVDISNLSCIVLFENVVGQTTIVTGRLYESACQVFDLIVECMDEPETHDRLYAITEHHQICKTSE